MEVRTIEAIKLTQKEETVLNVLWESDKPLTITQICQYAAKKNVVINHSTVQLAIKNLTKKELVKVGDIVQTSTVIARAFEPTMTPDEFAIDRFQTMMNKNGKNKISKIVAALLDHSDITKDDLSELSEIIKEMQEH